MDFSKKTKEELIKEIEFLKKQESNFSSVLKNVNVVIFKLSFTEKGDKSFEYFSPQVEKVLGITNIEYINAFNKGEIQNYFHPEDVNDIIEKSQKISPTNPEQTFSYRFYNKKTEKYVWIEENIVATFYKDNKKKTIFGTAKDISEKVEKENQLNFILDHIDECIYNVKFTTKGKILGFVSPQIKKITGLTTEEFIAEGKKGKLVNRIHPDDVNIVNKNIDEKLYKNKEKDIHSVFRFKPKGSKNYLWIEESLHALYNNKGELIETTTVLRDITKQQEQQELIKANVERFNILSDATNEVVMIHEKGVIIDINNSVKTIFGYDPRELIGKNGLCLTTKKTAEKVKESMLSTKNITYEAEGVKKDGSIFYGEVTSKAINFKGKNIKVVTIRDISDKKIAEKHLKESEEKYRTTFTKNLAGVFITEKNKIFDCNNSFARIFGYKTRVELIGKNVHDLYFSKKDRADYIKELSKKKYLTNYRIRHKNKKGEEIWILTNVYLKENGRIEGTLVDITDQVVIEKRLKESEENYKNLIEESPYGVLVHVDRKFIFANKKAVEILELKKNAEEIKKYNVLDFLMPEFFDLEIQRRKKLEKGETLPFIDIKIKTPTTNKIIEVTTKSTLIKYKGKDAVLIVFKDVSAEKELAKEKLRAQIAEESNKILQKEIIERKKIESKLVENQKYTNSIINSSLDIICASDKNGKIIEFNKAAEHAFGYDINEIFQKGVQIIYANKQEYLDVSKKLREEGVFVGEILNKRKNGEIFTSFLSASVLYNNDEEEIGTMGVSRDITELKEAEDQLIESEERYRDLFENSSDLIQSVDDEGKIEFVNTAWIKTMGYSADEIINKNIFDFIHPESREHCKKVMNEFVRKENNGKTERINFFLQTKKGNKLMLEGDMRIKNNANGISTRSILKNVTEERVAEQELKDSLKEKEVLLKEVHHRVKNNLQVISSILNLQSSYVKDENTLNILKESQNRIKSMSFIHESLYQTNDFSKINFSEYINNLSKNLVHSYGLFDNLIELRIKSEEIFLNLDLSIPCGLIVNELVSNALKYAFPKKKKGNINIDLFIKGGFVNLIIKDNGVGLPKGIDFRNTETLGLQLVNTLVEQINGEIQLSTNKGTTYTIAFKQNQ